MHENLSFGLCAAPLVTGDCIEVPPPSPVTQRNIFAAAPSSSEPEPLASFKGTSEIHLLLKLHIHRSSRLDKM